ncbi:MAG: hypothetical protein V2A76_14155 [Planctomycetota bacterium]
MNPDTPQGSQLSRTRKLLLLGAVGLVALCSIDTLFRVYLILTGGEWSPAQIRDTIRQIESAVGDLLPMPEAKKDEQTSSGGGTVLHPFTGFEIQGSLLQLEAERLRTGSKQDQETYDIAVLGGSVAGRFATLCADRFKEVLLQDPRFAGREIRLVEFARGGFKQPQQAAQFGYIISAGVRPDAVINIDGFNEAALGLNNFEHSVFPLYPSWSHWLFVTRSGSLSREQTQKLYFVLKVREKISETSELSRLLHLDWSAALGNLALARIRRYQRHYSMGYDQYFQSIGGSQEEATDDGVRGPRFGRETDIEQALDFVTESWVAASRSIDATCRLYSIPYLHVLQPTLHDEGAKPITDEERKKSIGAESWIKGAWLGYPKFRAAAPRLLEAGVHFHDSSRLFVDVSEPIYFDVCHFDGIGLELFAEDVARAFLEALPQE